MHEHDILHFIDGDKDVSDSEAVDCVYSLGNSMFENFILRRRHAHTLLSELSFCFAPFIFIIIEWTSTLSLAKENLKYIQYGI